MTNKISASIKNIAKAPLTDDPHTTKPTMSPRRFDFFHAVKLYRWMIITLVLIVALIGIGVSYISNEGRPVRTVTVKRGLLESSISATGKVVTAREVGLSSQVTGIITALHIKEGDNVRHNQTLLVLDTREAQAVLSRSEANLQAAKEGLAQAQRALESTRRLYDAGGEPHQAVENAESQQRITKNKVEVAQEDLRIARIGLANTRIQAPFAGLITAVTAQIGQWAAPGTRLLTLADPSRREIDVKVDAGDGGLVQVGQQTVVTSDAFPDRQWQERVLRLAPAIDKNETSNEFSIRLSLGAVAPLLRLGQQLDVKIQLTSKTDAITIPISALVSKDSATLLMVVRDERVHFSPVRTGIEDMSNIEIVEGIQPGDRIILPESKSFTEGERIRLIDGEQP